MKADFFRWSTLLTFVKQLGDNAVYAGENFRTAVNL